MADFSTISSIGIENLGNKLQIDDARIGSRSIEGPGAGVGAGNQAGGRSFGEILKDSVEQVNEHQVQADHAIKELVSGRTKNIHETMLAVERADASLKLMMQVRNKILEAYREVMRMQV